MKKVLLVLVVMLGQIIMLGQNLVPNPSFEVNDSCPSGPNQVNRVQNWFAVTNSPDYYNSCATIWTLSVPHNYLGYQFAHTGNAYCGMYSYASTDYREYIGTQVTSTLLVGQKYFISFYLSLSNIYNTGCNKFGCKLSTTPIVYNTLTPDNNDIFHSNFIVTDTVNWVQISGSFIADSAYNYIAFGNFHDNVNTDTTIIGLSNHGYYLIDDICLSSDSTTCNGIRENVANYSNVTPFVVFPNPTTSSFTITSTDKIKEVTMYDVLGCEILKQVQNDQSETIDVSKLPSGLYFAELVTEKGVMRRKFVKE